MGTPLAGAAGLVRANCGRKSTIGRRAVEALIELGATFGPTSVTWRPSDPPPWFGRGEHRALPSRFQVPQCRVLSRGCETGPSNLSCMSNIDYRISSQNQSHVVTRYHSLSRPKGSCPWYLEHCSYAGSSSTRHQRQLMRLATQFQADPSTRVLSQRVVSCRSCRSTLAEVDFTVAPSAFCMRPSIHRHANHPIKQ
jgi:hypothetical protein